MRRRAAAVLSTSLGLVLGLAVVAGPAPAAQRLPSAGSAGVGDPYFPEDGNGGYDARHYRLALKYQPRTNRLAGQARMTARAEKHLSRFNLDLDGLRVFDVRVNGRPADWSRRGGELRIEPRRALSAGKLFRTVIRYGGVPRTAEDGSGFIHTDDGALVIGEPHVAATWYPVNDHPIDKASYSFLVTVPKGRQAVANGELVGRRARNGWSTWHWVAREPMASYLTTASVGQWRMKAYRHRGIKLWDALDPDLFDPWARPHTGSRFAISQMASLSYKRLTRTIAVPDDGARLSFWVHRDTEPGWDFFFVEAHTPGTGDWTTLPDRNGHTSRSTGDSCPFWLGIHPFLAHYQSERSSGGCAPAGTTGTWAAATGQSDGYERWTVDLSRFAGGDVAVSLSYASDDIIQTPGVFVDDISVSHGPGSTSFERDGNVMDGWAVTGPPAGSPGNENSWLIGGTADGPPTTGEIAEGSLARQGEILDFLAGRFGPYPFSAAGGIVDDLEGLGFALENQTRPIYARDFFTDSLSGDAVVVHELAHQWYGDSLTVARWRHIWLNEGFATYAEWLWSGREGLGTPQEIFDFLYELFPPDDPFWQVRIGDPGPDLLFDLAVYFRGAMTLHQLRGAVGTEDFMRILRTWAQENRYGHVGTRAFIAHAERISGEQLDELFRTWLFTRGRPQLGAAAQRSTADVTRAPAVARVQLGRLTP